MTKIKYLKTFKVEVRKTCKVCGDPILGKRFRTYCSKLCRTKATNARSYKKNGADYQRKRNDKLASVYSPDKIQCPICKRWYVQVCSHALATHKIPSREFKEMFGYDVKKGRVPYWYRVAKGKQALENGTYKNLEAGKKYRFKKGQEGVGVYERSNETMERLKVLHKLNKINN